MSFSPGQAAVLETIERARMFASALRKTGRPVVLVPLGDGVHAGHIALIRAARRLPRAVVIVAYSGDDAEDLELLRSEMVDAIFRWSETMLWPRGLRTTVTAGEDVSDDQTVTRLLGLIGAVSPSDVVLGEKDYAVLIGVQRAVNDLHIPVQLHSVPVVRMPDGVPVSLRNRSVPEGARDQAVALSAALTAGAHAAEHGADVVLDTVGAVLKSAGIEPEYVSLRALDLGPAPEQGDARLFVAARIGGVLLEDNVGLPLGIGFRNIEGGD